MRQMIFLQRMHGISGLLDVKMDIEGAKVDIESAKVDIRNKLLTYPSTLSEKTINHAIELSSFHR